MMDCAILTGNLTLRPDWRNFVAEIKAPANYKDESKIKEYVEKKIQSLEQDIVENTSSLFSVSDPALYVPEVLFCTSSNYQLTDPDVATREGRMEYARYYLNCLMHSSSPVFGRRAVLRAWVNSMIENSDSQLSVAQDILHMGFRCYPTFASWYFPGEDNTRLLTEKLLPEILSGESQVQYIQRVLDKFGLVRGEWKTIPLD